jgi:hypothetical protein
VVPAHHAERRHRGRGLKKAQTQPSAVRPSTGFTSAGPGPLAVDHCRTKADVCQRVSAPIVVSIAPLLATTCGTCA